MRLPQSPVFQALDPASNFVGFSDTMMSGRYISDDLPIHYWSFTAVYPPLTVAQFRPISAALMKMKGVANPISVVHPTINYGGDLTAGRAMCLNGQEVGAWMMDSLTGSISDTELVTNGDFATDISGWTAAGNGTGSWNAGGWLDLTTANPYTSSADRAARVQTITTAIGQRYLVSFDNLTTNSLTVMAGTTSWNNDLGSAGSTVIQTESFEFTATGTTTYITAVGTTSAAATTSSVDNISVTAVVEDQTGNTPLNVNGTLSRAAVNTGCDLVGYSGYSAANFFSQDYDSAFNIGTGAVCIPFWFKDAGYNEYIFDRATTTTDRYAVYVNASGYLTLLTNDGSSSGLSATTLGDVTQLSGWQFGSAIRNTDGTITIWLNDKSETSGALTVRNITANSQPISVGLSYSSSGAWGGSLALLKIGLFQPTDEQVTRIYDIESRLFDGGEPLGIIPKVNGASQTGNSLTVDGCPASTDIFDYMDFFSIGTSPKVYSITKPATSNASGQATIEFEPDMIESPPDNAGITYYKVPFNMVNNNGVLHFPPDRNQRTKIEIDFVEAHG